MPAPSEPAADEQHSASWTAWLIWPFFLFAVYVLSVGPAIGLVERGYVKKNSTAFQSLAAFYASLDWMIVNDSPIGKVLMGYADVWRLPNHRK
jgi:hypothetical protein